MDKEQKREVKTNVFKSLPPLIQNILPAGITYDAATDRFRSSDGKFFSAETVRNQSVTRVTAQGLSDSLYNLHYQFNRSLAYSDNITTAKSYEFAAQSDASREASLEANSNQSPMLPSESKSSKLSELVDRISDNISTQRSSLIDTVVGAVTGLVTLGLLAYMFWPSKAAAAEADGEEAPGMVADREIERKPQKRKRPGKKKEEDKTEEDPTGGDTPPYDPVEAGKVPPDRAHAMKVIYDTYRKGGMTHLGAIGMLAHVGRETGGFSDAMYKSNLEPNPQRPSWNTGMHQWNSGTKRNDALKAFVQSRGVKIWQMAGKPAGYWEMEHTDAALVAQAEYALYEIKNEPYYKRVKEATMTPGKPYGGQMQEGGIEFDIGKYFEGWTYTHPKWGPEGRTAMRKYAAEANAVVGGTLTPGAMPSKGKQGLSVPEYSYGWDFEIDAKGKPLRDPNNPKRLIRRRGGSIRASKIREWKQRNPNNGGTYCAVGDSIAVRLAYFAPEFTRIALGGEPSQRIAEYFSGYSGSSLTVISTGSNDVHAINWKVGKTNYTYYWAKKLRQSIPSGRRVVWLLPYNQTLASRVAAVAREFGDKTVDLRLFSADPGENPPIHPNGKQLAAYIRQHFMGHSQVAQVDLSADKLKVNSEDTYTLMAAAEQKDRRVEDTALAALTVTGSQMNKVFNLPSSVVAPAAAAAVLEAYFDPTLQYKQVLLPHQGVLNG